jgi:hypothetical protein
MTGSTKPFDASLVKVYFPFIILFNSIPYDEISFIDVPGNTVQSDDD